MGLFDSISARLGGLPGGLTVPGPAMKKGVDKVLTASQMSVAASVTCTTTSWARVGTYTVLPQTNQVWGKGKEGVPQANLGILYFIPKTLMSVAIPCAVRLAIVNAEDIVQDYRIPSVRYEMLAKQLSDGKELVYFLEEKGYKAKPYDKLVLEILVDTNALYASSASSLLVDTALYI